jgi:hypothetical protein
MSFLRLSSWALAALSCFCSSAMPKCPPQHIFCDRGKLGFARMLSAQITQLRRLSSAPKLGKILYTAKVRTHGGRDGNSRSDDGKLVVQLSPPGTAGKGTNPEQLFAAGHIILLFISLDR